MKPANLRRRIEVLEVQFPTASVAVDSDAGERAFAKAVAFVEHHGGRQGNESWATAMARIMGMTTAALMRSLSDKCVSRYQDRDAR